MTAGRWAILLLDGRPEPALHHAWYIEGDEDTAEAFRAFVADEIDPAVKIRLGSPVAELLSWRTEVALPSAERALREMPGGCAI